LRNEDQSAGFRDEHGVNKLLVSGPEFGEPDSGRYAYMPAYQRYSGRFFTRLRDAEPGFWKRLSDRAIDILFLSGLYGMVLWEEPIQDYDCHLADYTAGHSRESIVDIWRKPLTEAPCALVRTARPGYGIVYDLLSDGLYQRAVGWTLLSSKGQIGVRHRVFRGVLEAEILSAIADALVRHLDLFDPAGSQLKRDTWFPLGQTGDPRFIGFETGPGSTELRDMADALIAENPFLRNLSRAALDALARAELGWRRTKWISNFDLGLAIVSYAKAVETYFRSDPSFGCGKDDDLKEIAATVKEKLPVADSINDLHKNFRNDAAHGDRLFDVNEVEEARKLAFTIIERAERRRNLATPGRVAAKPSTCTSKRFWGQISEPRTHPIRRLQSSRSA